MGAAAGGFVQPVTSGVPAPSPWILIQPSEEQKAPGSSISVVGQNSLIKLNRAPLSPLHM